MYLTEAVRGPKARTHSAMPAEGRQKRALLRVFVVDDEPIIAMTLALILERSGFSAVPYTNPMDAIVVPDEELPDVLISDVAMPQLSGIDLAIRMKQRRPECQVLLVSGQAATNDLLAAARRDGHNFLLLEKPILPSELLSYIQTSGRTVS